MCGCVALCKVCGAICGAVVGTEVSTAVARIEAKRLHSLGMLAMPVLELGNRIGDSGSGRGLVRLQRSCVAEFTTGSVLPTLLHLPATVAILPSIPGYLVTDKLK